MMNINCIICSDQIIASSEIYSTQCGHLFHYSCLIQWIERSKSCPQCRQRSTEKTIHRIYFNVANTNNIVDDDCETLSLKLDSLNFEMKLKEKDLQNHINRYQQSKQQNCELRKEIAKLEQHQRTIEQANNQLRDQLQFFKSKSKENQKLNDTIVDLKQQIKNYESIQLMINGTREDCNELLKETNDVESLRLLILTLKKALVDTEHKKLRYEHRYRHLQNDLNQLKRDLINKNQEGSDLKQKLEQNEKNWQLEKLEMRKLIEKLNIDKNDSLAGRVLLESPIPLSTILAKKRQLSGDNNNNKKSSIIEIDDESDSVVVVNDKNSKKVATESPYLQVKSTAYDYFLNNPTKNKSIHDRLRQQINNNNSNNNNKDVDYDGMGGHSKVDEFPTPKLKTIGLKRRVITSSASAKFRKLAPITKI